MANNIIAGDIDLDKIGKGRTVHDIADSIIKPFNRALIRIIVLSKNKSKNIRTESQTASLERVEGLVKIVTYECPPWCIARSFPHMISQKEHIVNKDPSFYDKKKFLHLVKPDERQQMILDLMDLIEMMINKASEDELNEAWDLIFVLLYTCVKFKEHIDATGIEYGQSWKY